MKKVTTHLTAAAGAVIILVAAVLLSCGETNKDLGPGVTNAGGTDNDFYVTGYLNDEMTGRVIPGATVELWDGTVFLGRTITNQYGGYTFYLGPEFALHDLTAVAKKEGYSDDVTTFRYYIDPVAGRWQNKDMFPGFPEPNGPGGNPPGPENAYTVRGYVNDRVTGLGVPGALVELYDTYYNPPEFIGSQYTWNNPRGRYWIGWDPHVNRDRHKFRAVITKQGYMEGVFEFKYYDDPQPTYEKEFDIEPLGE